MLGAILVKFVPEGPWGRGYYSYYSYDDWAANNTPQLPGSTAGEAENENVGRLGRLLRFLRRKSSIRSEQPI